MSRFIDIAKLHRQSFKETQEQYAKRFGFASATACSLWESGQRKVPLNVIEAAMFDMMPTYGVCGTCKGAGVLRHD